MRRATLTLAAFVAISFGRIAMGADVPGLTVHTDWKKVCFKNQRTENRKICETRARAGKWDDNSLLAAVAIIEAEEETRKVLRVIFPLGTQLKYGTRLAIHGDNTQQKPYVTCTSTGCISDYEVTPELLASMRSGQELLVQAIDQAGQPLNVTLSLAGFSGAYDSPRPELVRDEYEEPRKPWLDDTLRRELRPPVR